MGIKLPATQKKKRFLEFFDGILTGLFCSSDKQKLYVYLANKLKLHIPKEPKEYFVKLSSYDVVCVRNVVFSARLDKVLLWFRQRSSVNTTNWRRPGGRAADSHRCHSPESRQS